MAEIKIKYRRSRYLSGRTRPDTPMLASGSGSFISRCSSVPPSPRLWRAGVELIKYASVVQWQNAIMVRSKSGVRFSPLAPILLARRSSKSKGGAIGSKFLEKILN